MGYFDFQCANYDCEEWQGGQNDHDNYTVYVEVPLKSGNIIILKGEYDSYGNVEVGEETFKPIQFQNCTPDDLPEFIGNHYLCTKVWCSKCFNYDHKISDEISLDDLMTTDEYCEEVRIARRMTRDLHLCEQQLEQTNDQILKIHVETMRSVLNDYTTRLERIKD